MEGILKYGETEVQYNGTYYVVFDKVRYDHNDYYVLVNLDNGKVAKCLCGDLTHIKIKN